MFVCRHLGSRVYLRTSYLPGQSSHSQGIRPSTDRCAVPFLCNRGRFCICLAPQCWVHMQSVRSWLHPSLRGRPSEHMPSCVGSFGHM